MSMPNSGNGTRLAFLKSRTLSSSDVHAVVVVVMTSSIFSSICERSTDSNFTNRRHRRVICTNVLGAYGDMLRVYIYSFLLRNIATVYKLRYS